MLRYTQTTGIFNASGIFKTCQISKMTRDKAFVWYSQKSFFRHFQAYSGIFSKIEPCSGILRDIKAYSGIFEAY